MQRARTFFYVCAGALMLAMAYHLGASSASAQVGSSVSGFAFEGAGNMLVLTSNGDVYSNSDSRMTGGLPASLVGNFWGNAPTPAHSTSFGELKVRYR